MGNTWIPEERANECVAARPGQHHGRETAAGRQHGDAKGSGNKSHMRIINYNFKFLNCFVTEPNAGRAPKSVRTIPARILVRLTSANAELGGVS